MHPFDRGRYFVRFSGIFCTKIASICKRLIEALRQHYSKVRPDRSLGYRLPAPEAYPWPVPSSGSAALHLRPTLAKEAIMR
jgi:hypothetical protein